MTASYNLDNWRLRIYIRNLPLTRFLVYMYFYMLYAFINALRTLIYDFNLLCTLFSDLYLLCTLFYDLYVFVFTISKDWTCLTDSLSYSSEANTIHTRFYSSDHFLLSFVLLFTSFFFYFASFFKFTKHAQKACTSRFRIYRWQHTP